MDSNNHITKEEDKSSANNDVGNGIVMNKDLKDLEVKEITKIIKAIESEDGAEEFLRLAKLLLTKVMPEEEWELHEQNERQRLRQLGISEDLVTEIVALTVSHEMDCSWNGKACEFFSFDRHHNLICTMCPKPPYNAVKCSEEPIKGNIDEALAVFTILCEEHFRRVERHDMELVAAIIEAAKQRRKRM